MSRYMDINYVASHVWGKQKKIFWSATVQIISKFLTCILRHWWVLPIGVSHCHPEDFKFARELFIYWCCTELRPMQKHILPLRFLRIKLSFSCEQFYTFKGSFWNRELTWKLPITISDSTLPYRVRQKEAEEEERSREYMEDRMQAILSLKGNIETNKVW